MVSGLAENKTKGGERDVNEQETARLADCHPWSPHNVVRDREIKADTLPIGRVSSLMCFFAVAVALDFMDDATIIKATAQTTI